MQDIANAIAADFVKEFDASVAASAQASLEKRIAAFKTEVSMKDGLGIDLESEWDIVGTGYGVFPILFVPTNGGFFTNVSQKITFPPFKPKFAPDSKYLDSPAQDFNIAITEYFFDSFTWALGSLGYFDTTILSDEVPKASPVQLSTNDDFFLQVVPGLEQYPNMDITVKTRLVASPLATIDTTAVYLQGLNISFDFTLSNKSYSHEGWTLSNIFDLELNVMASASGQVIMFNTSLVNFSSIVEVTESSVGGNITADGFEQLYGLLESQIKLPGFAIHIPEDIDASHPTIKFYDHFIGFGVDFKYHNPKDQVVLSQTPKVSICVV